MNMYMYMYILLHSDMYLYSSKLNTNGLIGSAFEYIVKVISTSI